VRALFAAAKDDCHEPNCFPCCAHLVGHWLRKPEHAASHELNGDTCSTGARLTARGAGRRAAALLFALSWSKLETRGHSQRTEQQQRPLSRVCPGFRSSRARARRWEMAFHWMARVLHGGVDASTAIGRSEAGEDRCFDSDALEHGHVYGYPRNSGTSRSPNRYPLRARNLGATPALLIQSHPLLAMPGVRSAS